jgi:hypothetical protein
MKGSEMKTTANHPTEARAGTISKRPAKNCVLFVATCPKCRRQVLQHGYSRVLLFAYLDVEHEIEAYCAACDEFWPINAVERRGIVGALLPGPM